MKEYKGLEFLDECYEAEHTLSLDDAVEDLTIICKRNGGNIEWFKHSFILWIFFIYIRNVERRNEGKGIEKN